MVLLCLSKQNILNQYRLFEILFIKIRVSVVIFFFFSFSVNFWKRSTNVIDIQHVYSVFSFDVLRSFFGSINSLTVHHLFTFYVSNIQNTLKVILFSFSNFSINSKF